MIFLLYFQETLILPYNANQVKVTMMRQVRTIEKFKRPYSAGVLSVDTIKFNGFFKDNEFRIFKALNYPQNFVPLIVGKLEPTSKGCIVFLKYRLFLSTLIFLIFWISICLFFTFFFLFYYQSYPLAGVSLLLGIINYSIAVAAFKMHLKKTRKELHEILS